MDVAPPCTSPPLPCGVLGLRGEQEHRACRRPWSGFVLPGSLCAYAGLFLVLSWCATQNRSQSRDSRPQVCPPGQPSPPRAAVLGAWWGGHPCDSGTMGGQGEGTWQVQLRIPIRSPEWRVPLVGLCPSGESRGETAATPAPSWLGGGEPHW